MSLDDEDDDVVVLQEVEAHEVPLPVDESGAEEGVGDAAGGEDDGDDVDNGANPGPPVLEDIRAAVFRPLYFSRGGLRQSHCSPQSAAERKGGEEAPRDMPDRGPADQVVPQEKGAATSRGGTTVGSAVAGPSHAHPGL